MRKAVPFLLFFVLAACAGTTARTHVLWPATKAAWPAVKSDIQLALEGKQIPAEVTAAINQIDGAVAADSYELLKGVAWFALEPLAAAGIARRVDRGDISQGVGESFRARLSEFNKAMSELAR